MPIRVLIVDDSAVVRSLLSRGLASYEDLQVLAGVKDPYEARDFLENQEVDVITLDLEMPRMDGLTFLRHLMRDYPLPVIIVSSLAQSQAPVTLDALRLGAFDYVQKPQGSLSVREIIQEIAQKIRQAANYDARKRIRLKQIQPDLNKEKPLKELAPHCFDPSKIDSRVIVLGASTGGTLALEYIFTQLPDKLPPIICVIHMPEYFTKLFAQRLNALSQAHIKEAEDAEVLQSGTIYIAPGNYHTSLEQKAGLKRIHTSTGPKVFGQRPSVDILFDSVSEISQIPCLALLLTGMGRDGALGLKHLHDRKAYTIAQNEESSVVFGMPKEAIKLGAADKILPLSKIPEAIIQWSRQNASSNQS